MRISIWQQFSSNHSNDFTIVGLFKTHKEAQQAAETVRAILKDFAQWFGDPQNADTVRQYYESHDIADTKPRYTPPEIALNEKYGIGFSETPIDWLVDAEIAPKAVLVFDQLVFIDNDFTRERSYTGGHPFDLLLKKLGAKVGLQNVTYSACVLRIMAEAPDEETANKICEALRAKANQPDLVSEVPYLDALRYEELKCRHAKQTLYFDFSPVTDMIDDLIALKSYLESKNLNAITYQILPYLSDEED